MLRYPSSKISSPSNYLGIPKRLRIQIPNCYYFIHFNVYKMHRNSNTILFIKTKRKKDSHSSTAWWNFTHTSTVLAKSSGFSLHLQASCILQLIVRRNPQPIMMTNGPVVSMPLLVIAKLNIATAWSTSTSSNQGELCTFTKKSNGKTRGLVSLPVCVFFL